MPPDISKIGSPLAVTVRLVHRAALRTMLMDTNSEKAKARKKRHYNKHFRFEPRLAAGDYNFVEHPPVIADADRMTFERNKKQLTRRAGPYRAISVDSSTPRLTKAISRILYQ